MKKITIIGCTGSGKTYFAKKLSTKLNIPLYTIDEIYFGNNWTKLSQSELQRKLEEIMQTNEWIIDGQFTKHIPLRLAQVDTIIYFDLSRMLILSRILKRYIRLLLKKEHLPHDSKPKFPWHNMKLMLRYPKKEVCNMLDKAPEGVSIIFFKKRDEVESFLNAL